jgi:hypothetical protein
VDLLQLLPGGVFFTVWSEVIEAHLSVNSRQKTQKMHSLQISNFRGRKKTFFATFEIDFCRFFFDPKILTSDSSDLTLEGFGLNGV